MSPEAAETPFDDYLKILLERRWSTLAVMALVVVLALLQVLTTTPQYRSTVTLQIDPEDSKVLPYEEIARTGNSQLQQEEYLWTQAEKLRSRSLALRVVERLRLADEPAFTEPGRRGLLLDSLGAAIELGRGLFRRAPSARGGAPASGDEEENLRRALAARFAGFLEVQLVRNTRLVKVSFTSPDPALAAEICNVLAEEFIEQHLESKFNATVRATEFLNKQLGELKSRVEESEANLLRYAQAKNIVSVNERQPIGRQKLEDLSAELNRAENELVEQTVRYEALSKVGAGAFPEILKTPKIRQLESRLSELESELAGLSGRYGPEWPAIKEARLEIGEVEQQLAAEQSRATESARAEYRIARARHERLSTVMDGQRQVVDRLDEDSIQYRILEREVETNKELYEGLLQRLKEAGVAAGLRSSNVQVVDHAVPPRFAATPQKTRALMLALVLGTLLGVGAALLTETFDKTLKSTEDVTVRLGLPSLGVIPTLRSAGNGHRRRRLGFGKAAARRPRPHLAHGTPRDQGHARRKAGRGLGAEEVGGRAWEAYRSLRTSILLSYPERPPKVLLVTSALPGEGKTTTAANMALALAHTGARTVVIDLDLRRPALAQTFGLPTQKGMSTYLSGHSDLATQIRATRIPHLFVVGAGPRAPNPPELLGSPRMAKALEVLREYFTYVVIDTPPALELSDARVVAARNVDGVILVARGGKTPHPALRRTSDGLARVGARVLGVLLNDVDIEALEYRYHYGYGSYEGYYAPEGRLPAPPGATRRASRGAPAGPAG